MSQSFRQIVHEVAGQEKDPVVYRFTGRRREREFTEPKIHGVYDGDNEGSDILFEDGSFIRFEDGTYLEAEE